MSPSFKLHIKALWSDADTTDILSSCPALLPSWSCFVLLTVDLPSHFPGSFAIFNLPGFGDELTMLDK